jgi:hypothetical protein
MVRVSHTVLPDPAMKSVYDGKYARYRRFLEALGAAWD